MGIVRKTLVGVVLTPAILILSILLIPGLPPDIDFKPFNITPPTDKILKLLDSNDVLEKAELYYESSHIGIESVVELDDGTLIASDQSGAIYRITAKQTAINITQLKFPCESSPFGGGGDAGVNNCGWPLGMRLVNMKDLYFMDYFGGMAKLDLGTGAYETLVSKSSKIDGKVGATYEDLDVAKDDTIYWTDGSIYDDFFVEMLGQPSGRLIKYDPIKKTNEVLLDDLHFSNGLCLSEKEDFVLVAEMGSARIRRYYLKGEKKGKNDMFFSGLPGVPDNIRTNRRGGFYVALFMPWNENSMNTRAYSNRPLFRKFILRLRYILLAILSHIKPMFNDNVYLNELQQQILEIRPLLRIHERPQVAIIAELSNSGELLGIFSGKSGKIPNVSQVTIGKKYAYLACPFDTKLWRIDKKYLVAK